MTDPATARKRLLNQHLIGPRCATPAQLVTHMGAVQGQEYDLAMWAIGQRLTGKPAQDQVEQAVAERSIVRTCYMRATLHFVPAPDYRWMMTLQSDRLRAMITGWAGRNGIDERTFRAGNDLLAQVLAGGSVRTRAELTVALKEAGLLEHGYGPSVMFQRAQVDQVIVQAARRGKQRTFALLDDWLPITDSQTDPEHALAELARRYYISHGPATVHDFARWAGVTVGEAQRATDLTAKHLHREMTFGLLGWSAPAPAPAEDDSGAHRAFLLPIYDEYVNGYKIRHDIITSGIDPRRWKAFRNTYDSTSHVLIGGMVAGAWRRTPHRDRVHIQIAPYHDLGRAERQLVEDAAELYGAFIGRSPEVAYTSD